MFAGFFPRGHHPCRLGVITTLSGRAACSEWSLGSLSCGAHFRAQMLRRPTVELHRIGIHYDTVAITRRGNGHIFIENVLEDLLWAPLQGAASAASHPS